MLEVGGILVFTSCHATASIWPHVSSHCCRVMWMVRSLVERKTGSEVSICIFNTYDQCHLAPLYSSVGRHGRPSPQTGTHFRSGVSDARFGPALQSGPLRSSWKLDLGLLFFFLLIKASPMAIHSTSRWVQDFIRKLRRAVDVALLSLKSAEKDNYCVWPNFPAQWGVHGGGGLTLLAKGAIMSLPSPIYTAFTLPCDQIYIIP